MIPVEQALRTLVDAVELLEVETIALEQARGRVLAESVEADRDFPPTDRSAMDGYAVRSADVDRPGVVLSVTGELRAGEPARGSVTPGTALRIYTGAVLPTGADAVVMVEHTREDGPSAVRIDRAAERGQHIRKRGQDLGRGTRVLEPGEAIRAAEIAALASVGRSRVRVFRRPEVRVLSTGDEIVDPDRTPGAHQIRNSNAPMLAACLAGDGFLPAALANAPDRPEELAEQLEQGMRGDLLMISGGVSVGRYDLVREALTKLGMETLFHGVAMKPGKPILAGRRGGCTVVGLPGNPLSAFVGYTVLVAPALRRMTGRSRWDNLVLTAALHAPLSSKPGRTTFHLASIAGSDGELRVTPVRSTGSGDVLSLSRANAFIIVTDEGADDPAGTRVRVMPWRGFDSG